MREVAPEPFKTHVYLRNICGASPKFRILVKRVLEFRISGNPEFPCNMCVILVHASDQYPKMPLNVVQRLLLPACKTVRPSAARVPTGESQCFTNTWLSLFHRMYVCVTYLG